LNAVIGALAVAGLIVAFGAPIVAAFMIWREQETAPAMDEGELIDRIARRWSVTPVDGCDCAACARARA
jgi:hypothetical protein